jgi:hypothetical protein
LVSKEALEKPKEVKYDISDEIGYYLDQLEKKGTFGKTRTEMVRMLVRDQIEQLLKDKRLTEPKDETGRPEDQTA